MLEMICEWEDGVYEAVKESNEKQLLELLERGADPNAWLRQRDYRYFARPPTPIATLSLIQRKKFIGELGPWEGAGTDS